MIYVCEECADTRMTFSDRLKDAYGITAILTIGEYESMLYSEITVY